MIDKLLKKLEDHSDISALRHDWQQVEKKQRSFIRATIRDLAGRHEVWEKEESLTQDARYTHGHRRAALYVLLNIIDEILEKKNEV